MKSSNLIVMLLAMMCMAANTYAQDNKETKTLLGGKKVKPFRKINYLGLYVAPEIQYAGLAGGFTPMGGVSAMLQINKKWGVGGVAYTSFEDYTPTKLSTEKTYIFDAQFGGLKLEYTAKPNALVHVSFPLIIGAGMAKIDSVGKKEGRDMFEENDQKGEGMHFEGNKRGRRDDGEDNLFYVIQPGIHLEMNVIKYAKVYLGASYRIAAGKSDAASTNPLLIPTSSQMNGFAVHAGIKVGLFDFNIRKKKVTPEN